MATEKFGISIGETVPTIISAAFIRNPRGPEKIIKITFRGSKITGDELGAWASKDVPTLLSQLTKGQRFFVLVDLVTVNIIQETIEPIMVQGQQAFLANGMAASFIYSSRSNVISQFKRIAAKSTIDKNERGTYVTAEVAAKYGRKLDEALLNAALAWYYDRKEPAFTFA